MVRILVTGPVSNLGDSVGKFKKLNIKNGPFEMNLLVSMPTDATQAISMPVPTYFVAESFDGVNSEKCDTPGLHYKGASLNESMHGLHVVMCSTDSAAALLCERIDGQEDSVSDVDILVTHCGPKGLSGGSEDVSKLGKIVKPRYHFFGAEKFQAYDPFQIHGADYACRVIAVGKTGRWVYAADMAALSGMSREDRVATLPKLTGADLYHGQDAKRKRCPSDRRERVHKKERRDCWFCLSNDVEKHLVVGVGQRAYVALAKGGVNDSHLVVVPVMHIAGMSSEGFDDDTADEMERTIQGIRKYYETCKQSQAMVFAWCGGGDVMHMCVQAVAIRAEACGRVADMCVETAKRFGVALTIESGLNGLREARRVINKHGFWAELPNGTRVVAPFEEKKGLPASFGRVVAAQALGVVERIEWRKCVRARAEEDAIARRVDAHLAPFLAAVR